MTPQNMNIIYLTVAVAIALMLVSTLWNAIMDKNGCTGVALFPLLLLIIGIIVVSAIDTFLTINGF